MKKTSFLCIIAIIITFCCTEATAQRDIYKYFTINFDDPVSDTCVLYYADTIHNPNNVWQVGHSHKPALQGTGNVLMTDTINPYPPNDTSYFVIKLWDHWLTYSHAYNDSYLIEFEYYSKTDTLQDVGIIEFSYTNGESWVNLNSPSNYECWSYIDEVHPISGQTYGIKNIFLLYSFNYGAFCFDLSDTIPDSLISDTVAFRIGFISDGTSTRTEGILINEIIFLSNIHTMIEHQPFVEKGVSLKIQSNKVLVVESSSLQSYIFELVNITGSLAKKEIISKEYVEFDLSMLPVGLYFAQIFDNDGNIIERKKILISN